MNPSARSAVVPSTLLTYYPDVDTLDVFFQRDERAVATIDAPRPDGTSSEDLRLHYQDGKLIGLTYDHATKTAPWDVQSLRRIAAQKAAKTGHAVQHLTMDADGRVHHIEQDSSSRTPLSEHTSDAAVQAYNEMVNQHLETQPS